LISSQVVKPSVAPRSVRSFRAIKISLCGLAGVHELFHTLMGVEKFTERSSGVAAVLLRELIQNLVCFLIKLDLPCNHAVSLPLGLHS